MRFSSTNAYGIPSSEPIDSYLSRLFSGISDTYTYSSPSTIIDAHLPWVYDFCDIESDVPHTSIFSGIPNRSLIFHTAYSVDTSTSLNLAYYEDSTSNPEQCVSIIGTFDQEMYNKNITAPLSWIRLTGTVYPLPMPYSTTFCSLRKAGDSFSLTDSPSPFFFRYILGKLHYTSELKEGNYIPSIRDKSGTAFRALRFYIGDDVSIIRSDGEELIPGEDYLLTISGSRGNAHRLVVYGNFGPFNKYSYYVNYNAATLSGSSVIDHMPNYVEEVLPHQIPDDVTDVYCYAAGGEYKYMYQRSRPLFLAYNIFGRGDVNIRINYLHNVLASPWYLEACGGRFRMIETLSSTIKYLDRLGYDTTILQNDFLDVVGSILFEPMGEDSSGTVRIVLEYHIGDVSPSPVDVNGEPAIVISDDTLVLENGPVYLGPGSRVKIYTSDTLDGIISDYTFDTPDPDIVIDPRNRTIVVDKDNIASLKTIAESSEIYVNYQYIKYWEVYRGYDTPALNYRLDFNPMEGHFIGYSSTFENLIPLGSVSPTLWYTHLKGIVNDPIIVDSWSSTLIGSYQFDKNVGILETSGVYSQLQMRNVAAMYAPSYLLFNKTVHLYSIPSIIYIEHLIDGQYYPVYRIDYTGTTLLHTFDSSMFLSYSNGYNPLALRLAIINLIPNSSPITTQYYDSRRKGGEHISSTNVWDKHADDSYPIAGAVVVHLPSLINDQLNSGIITQEYLDSVVSKFIAAGVEYVIKYE